jgi:uncharacterized delta-60 repeat protein
MKNSIHAMGALLMGMQVGQAFPQPPGTVEFFAAGFSVNETAASAQVILHRSFPYGPPFTVEFSTRDASALAGEDYAETNLVVSFPSGLTNLIVRVRILDDTRFEGVETFTVSLANPSAGVVLGSPSQATVTIVDNESNAPGSMDDAFNAGSGCNGPVLCLTLRANGKVIAGGAFTQVDGQNRVGLAQFNKDGTLDSFDAPALAPGDVVLAAAEQPDNKLIVARTRLVEGFLRGQLVRLRVDGGLDQGFAGGILQADAPIRTVALQGDGSIIVGGAFTSLGDAPRNYLARVDSAGALDPSFQPGLNGPVNCVVLLQDGRFYCGGAFTHVEGLPSVYLARLGPDGTPDETFTAGAGNLVCNGTGVASVAIQGDGKPILSGDFSVLYGRGRTGLVRLSIDGMVDDSYDPKVPTGDAVHAVVLQPDGKAIIGGDFTRLANPLCCSTFDRKGIARLHRDGSVDTSFNPGQGLQPPEVLALALQPDLRVLVGGAFTNANGLTRIGLSRLYGDIRINQVTYHPSEGVALGITNEPGHTYVIEASSNFLEWTALATLVPASNTFNFLDATATNLPRRIYRVRE